jgi:hypothetical protein
MVAVTDLDWLFDGIAGPGWIRRTGGDGVDNAHIFLDSEADRERQEARAREPHEPMRWRRHGDSWQRWSPLDQAFATVEAPDSLEAHVAAVGMPAEDEELLFIGGTWMVADDQLGVERPPG